MGTFQHQVDDHRQRPTKLREQLEDTAHKKGMKTEGGGTKKRWVLGGGFGGRYWRRPNRVRVRRYPKWETEVKWKENGGGNL